jgi:hypothetical protein
LRSKQNPKLLPAVAVRTKYAIKIVTGLHSSSKVN